MSAPIAELDKLLVQIIAEHKTLLGGISRHLEAMKTFKIGEVAAATDVVEASRVRIVMFEHRRKMLLQQITRTYKVPLNATLRQLADASPADRDSLLRRRDELQQVTAQIAEKTNVSSRVAGALLGHLNTVVRIVAGAMHQRTVYTKQGVPTVASRIGLIEAVG